MNIDDCANTLIESNVWLNTGGDASDIFYCNATEIVGNYFSGLTSTTSEAIDAGDARSLLIKRNVFENGMAEAIRFIGFMTDAVEVRDNVVVGFGAAVSW